MRTRWLELALALALLQGAAFARADIVVGHFSAMQPGGAIEGWAPYAVGKSIPPTQYSLARVDGVTVLEARADKSASGLAFALRADPAVTPWLTWRWRTDHALQRADMHTKAGDDFVARIYVLFDYDLARLPLGERIKIRLARSLYGNQVPTAALCYVWDNRQPVGHTQWSPYTERMRVIVASETKVATNQWLTISRNVAEDFRAAFGEAAPPITAIIVATDTDNTQDTALTWFGDITLRGSAETP